MAWTQDRSARPDRWDTGTVPLIEHCRGSPWLLYDNNNNNNTNSIDINNNCHNTDNNSDVNNNNTNRST